MLTGNLLSALKSDMEVAVLWGHRPGKGDLYHYSFNSIAQHVDKVNKYSSLIAAERLSHGRTGSAFKMIFGPIATFFKFYIIKTGFLDGRNGFIIAVISAYDNFLRSAKMRGK